jgi:hypothetical protein
MGKNPQGTATSQAQEESSGADAFVDKPLSVPPHSVGEED